MDWSIKRDDIEKLIYLYKQNRCLWDYSCKDYKRTDLKKEAWQNMAHIFKKDVEVIKKKMKYLRSAYVNEKKKVEEYRGVIPTYQPHLFYYDEMAFLDPVIVLRNNPTYGQIEKFENTDVYEEYTMDPIDDRTNMEHLIEEVDVSPETPPLSLPSQTSRTEDFIEQSNAKKRRLAPYYSKLNNSVSTSAQATVTGFEESIYNSFGTTIALQLSQLSPLDANITMAEIYKIISKNVVKSLLSRSNVQRKVSKDLAEEQEVPLATFLESFQDELESESM